MGEGWIGPFCNAVGVGDQEPHWRRLARRWFAGLFFSSERFFGDVANGEDLVGFVFIANFGDGDFGAEFLFVGGYGNFGVEEIAYFKFWFTSAMKAP
ncbi:MAG: hypothetical protein IPF56_14495 [Chloroflexi bacterium]|nr:hypothetical protein [Chloroflexota bacterium]